MPREPRSGAQRQLCRGLLCHFIDSRALPWQPRLAGSRRLGSQDQPCRGSLAMSALVRSVLGRRSPAKAALFWRGWLPMRWAASAHPELPGAAAESRNLWEGSPVRCMSWQPQRGPRGGHRRALDVNGSSAMDSSARGGQSTLSRGQHRRPRRGVERGSSVLSGRLSASDVLVSTAEAALPGRRWGRMHRVCE